MSRLQYQNRSSVKCLTGKKKKRIIFQMMWDGSINKNAPGGVLTLPSLLGQGFARALSVPAASSWMLTVFVWGWPLCSVSQTCDQHALDRIVLQEPFSAGFVLGLICGVFRRESLSIVECCCSLPWAVALGQLPVPCSCQLEQAEVLPQWQRGIKGTVRTSAFAMTGTTF